MSRLLPTQDLKSEACAGLFEKLLIDHHLHAVKLYRIAIEGLQVPVLPCLDHEAMLHEGIEPHAAAYIEHKETGDLHEVVMIPDRCRIDIDVVSTIGEFSQEAHDKLTQWLKNEFTTFKVKVAGPSCLRGDKRVARASRAQVSLREVLTSESLDEVTKKVDRLRVIGGLMEKESRVASWSIRTVTGPLLAVAGFVAYQVIETLRGSGGDHTWLVWVRYGVLGGLGTVFLYFGLKAVHLTEMANRVWKRTSEYLLIVSERRRLLG